MSIKVKQALTKCFQEIRDQIFDENTIRTLLIVGREYVKTEGLIKELAHFIAHPIRDKGLCHKKVNNRYAKVMLVDKQLHTLIVDGRLNLNGIETEDQLSDFMLGAVNVDKVEATLFEILYFDGLADISEEHLLKYSGFNRKDALSVLKRYYIKHGDHYYCKVNNMMGLNEEAAKLPLPEAMSPEEAQAGYEQVKINLLKIKATIDALQKVIRGTIEYRSIFEPEDLYKELNTSFAGIIKKFGIEGTLLESIKTYQADILLCIMTLLHDSTFTFFDGTVAQTFLCAYNDDKLTETTTGSAESTNYWQTGVLALYITFTAFDKINSYPLFVSDLKLPDYLSPENLRSLNTNGGLIKEIPWTTAARIDGKLKLVATV